LPLEPAFELPQECNSDVCIGDTAFSNPEVSLKTEFHSNAG